MNPSELLELPSCLPEHAEHFALQGKLVDSPRIGVRRKQHLIRRRRDANRPRRTRRKCSLHVRTGFIPNHGASVRREGNIDADLAKELAFRIKDLDTPIASIRNIDVVLCIGSNAMGSIQLPGLIAGFPPGLDPVAVFVDFGDP